MLTQTTYTYMNKWYITKNTTYDNNNKGTTHTSIDKQVYNIYYNKQHILTLTNGRADTYPSFATGGDLWFVDLTIADPLYVLPALTAASMILTIELVPCTLHPAP